MINKIGLVLLLGFAVFVAYLAFPEDCSEQACLTNFPVHKLALVCRRGCDLRLESVGGSVAVLDWQLAIRPPCHLERLTAATRR
jgi:hypothetical protein